MFVGGWAAVTVRPFGRPFSLQRKCKQLGVINIHEGTKGGRTGASAPRWITVDSHLQEALTFAQKHAPRGSRNLLDLEKS